MIVPLHERCLSVGKVVLNVACSATVGPKLLMLHGVTRRWQTFLPLLPSLAETWQVMAPDFPGHGGSGRSEEPYLVIDYVRDVVALIQTQTTEPVVLYGHSLGAMVAAAVAAELPRQVKAIVLEDPPFDTMGQRIAQTRLQTYFAGMHALADSGRSGHELVDEVAHLKFVDPETGESQRLGDLRDKAALRFTADCLACLDPKVLEPIVAGRWLEGYDRKAILKGIRCPVLLLQADLGSGGMLTSQDAAELQTNVARSSTIQFPGVGHLIHDGRPLEVLEVMQDFFRSADLPNTTPSHRTA